MNPSTHRYAQLIEATLRVAVQTRGDAVPPAGSLEHGLVLARRAIGQTPTEADRRSVAHLGDQSTDVRWSDSAGHRRPVYGGLARYVSAVCGGDAVCGREAGSTPPEPTPPGPKPPGPTTWDARAANGSATSLWVWRLVAACPAGVASRSSLHALFDRQHADGTFLSRTASDNPEPWWYDEATILHAVASYAIRSGDGRAIEAMRRAADFHVAEIQPDHASQQPWAIHAFLLQSTAVMLADHMLHAAAVQRPAAMDAVSLVLLADALDCLRVWGAA